MSTGVLSALPGVAARTQTLVSQFGRSRFRSLRDFDRLPMSAAELMQAYTPFANAWVHCVRYPAHALSHLQRMRGRPAFSWGITTPYEGVIKEVLRSWET